MKNKLPPYVYERKARNAYIWRPYIKGQPRREHVLCSLSEPLSTVWRLWEERTGGGIKSGTVAWLLTVYLESDQFASRQDNTQQVQRSYANSIMRAELVSGRTLGDVRLQDITPGFWSKYMDSLKRKNTPQAGNLHRALLSTAWNWANSRDVWHAPNPIPKSVKHAPSRVDRYVTDDEYLAVLTAAKSGNRYPWLWRAMELAMLCRLRSVEVRDMSYDQLLANGILCSRRKGSKSTIVEWSPRLRQATSAIADSDFVVHYPNGQQVGRRTLNQAFNAARNAAGVDHFRFHDLKAKGISDTDPAMRKTAGGHRSDASADVYDRAIDVVQVPKPQ